MSLYDPTGGRDASIYADQCRFERWQWHVEDERILPAPVLAEPLIRSRMCSDGEAQASNESRLSQLNGQTLAAGNSLYETTIQSSKDIAATLPGPDHDEAPADSRCVP